MGDPLEEEWGDRHGLNPSGRTQQWQITLIVLLVGCLIVISCLYGPYSYDYWWHLRLGTDWVEEGLSPWIDRYSFTFAGEPVVNPPVLFEASIYWFTHWLGTSAGHNTYRIVGYLSLLAVLVIWLRQVRARPAIYFLVLVLVLGALQLRIFVRPEIMTYPLCILALILYQRSRLELSFRVMFPIVLLLAAWSAYHTPIFGYLIFFGLFVDIAVRLVQEKAALGSWLAWLGWGLATVLAGFFNPELSHFLIDQFKLSGDWDEYIWEYRSAYYLKNRFAVYLLLVAGLLATGLAVHQRRLGYFVVLLVLFAGSIHMSRIITPAGIIVAAMLGHLLSVVLYRPEFHAAKQQRWKVGATLAFAIVGLASGILETRKFVVGAEQASQQFPSALTRHMRENERTGNVFHLFRLGGFLMHELTPRNAIYIDGRTNILFPIEHYQRYVSVLQDPRIFVEEAADLDIEYAVLPATDGYALQMWQSGFSLDFSDVLYALYARDNGSLSHLGRLWAHPYCWDSLETQPLFRETRSALRALPRGAAIQPLLELVHAYETATDRLAFFDTFDPSVLNTAHFVRAYAFLALANERPDIALTQFGRLENLPPKDRLAVVLAHVRADDVQAANREMEMILRDISAWRGVEPIDLVVLRALIDELKDRGELPYLTDAVDHGLSREVGHRALSAQGRSLTVNEFCTHSPTFDGAGDAESRRSGEHETP